MSSLNRSSSSLARAVALTALAALPFNHARAQATFSDPPAAQAADSPYSRGMDAYKRGDTKAAIDQLTLAVKADEGNGDAQAVLGFLLAQEGDYAKAMPHLEKATTLKTTVISPANSRMNLGKALLLRPGHTADDTTRAITHFEKAVSLSPKSVEAEMTLGFGYTRIGSFDKAASAYRAAAALAPKNAAAWKGLGVSLRKTGDNDGATDALRKCVALNGTDADAWATLGSIEIDRHDDEAARNALETARKLDDKNVLVLVALGTIYAHESRPGDAADAFGAAADRIEAGGPVPGAGQTDLATLRYDQGVALAQAGRNDDAAIAYDKALALNPKSPEALLNSGTILYGQGKFAQATLRFKSAATLQPTSVLAWRNLAAAFTHQSDWVGAAEAGRHLAALLPNDYDVRDALVQAIIQTNPTSDEVGKFLHQMAALHPTSADPLVDLGLLYQRQAEEATLASAKQAKFLAAMQAFQQAIVRDPKSAIAYNDLGVVHERRGEIDEALKAYKKAVALDPTFADAKKNLDRFHPAR